MSDSDATLTITLTGRRPVQITKAEWPVIASVRDSWCDDKIESQANRKKWWRLFVRQCVRPGEGAKYIVHGLDGWEDRWARDGRETRAGVLVEGDLDAVIAGIHEVAATLSRANGSEDQLSHTWATMAQNCIADLPAEVL